MLAGFLRFALLSVALCLFVASGHAQTPSSRTLIVEVARPTGPSRQQDGRARQAQMRAQIAAALQLDGAAVEPLQVLPYFIVRNAPATARGRLLQIPDVKAVFEDRRHRTHLDQSLAVINQPSALLSGATGQGTSVAVLDTGADYHQPDFGICQAPGPSCRVSVALDIARDDGQLDDQSRHGTNVAAIVARTAPRTSIIALDVFDGQDAYASDGIRALDWVAQNRTRHNIVAVNLSFGDSNSHSQICANDVFDAAFQVLELANVAIVASSGNDNVKNGLSPPACHPLAVAVGATTDAPQGPVQWTHCQDPALRQDAVPCFSNSGSGLDLLAPGHSIAAGGTQMSGTSQAAPHVAGAIAALMSTDPNMRARSAIARLRNTGMSIVDQASNQRTPRTDLGEAANRVPQAATDHGIAAEGGGGVFDVVANDRDEEPARLRLVGAVAPAGCHAHIANNLLYAACDAGQAGERRFRYAVADRFGDTGASELVLDVRRVATLPPRSVGRGRVSRLFNSPLGPAVAWLESGTTGRVMIEWLRPDGSSSNNVYQVRQGAINSEDLYVSNRGDLYALAWSEDLQTRTVVYAANFRGPELGTPYNASFNYTRSIHHPFLASFDSTVLVGWQDAWNPSAIHAQLNSYNPVATPEGSVQQLVRTISPAQVQSVTISPSDHLLISSNGQTIVVRRFSRDGVNRWNEARSLRDNGNQISAFDAEMLADGSIGIAWTESNYVERRTAWYMRINADGRVIQAPQAVSGSNVTTEAGDVQLIQETGGRVRVLWSERWTFGAIISRSIDSAGAMDPPLIEFFTTDFEGGWPIELQALPLSQGRYLLSWASLRSTLQAMVRSAPR